MATGFWALPVTRIMQQTRSLGLCPEPHCAWALPATRIMQQTRSLGLCPEPHCPWALPVARIMQQTRSLGLYPESHCGWALPCRAYNAVVGMRQGRLRPIGPCDIPTGLAVVARRATAGLVPGALRRTLLQEGFRDGAHLFVGAGGWLVGQSVRRVGCRRGDGRSGRPGQGDGLEGDGRVAGGLGEGRQAVRIGVAEGAGRTPTRSSPSSC